MKNSWSRRVKIKIVYQMLCASLAWATLVAKFVVELTSGNHAGIAATALHYTSYFTHVSVLLVALVFTASILPTQSRLHAFFQQSAPRAAVALYIIVVAIVHHLLLADLKVRVGWSATTNTMLHTVVPALYLVDWLVYAPKRRMSFTSIHYWLIYPAFYGLWAITKGALWGGYPYPFLNVSDLGPTGVTMNMLGFLALFSIGAAIFITSSRVFPPPSR